MWHIKSTIVPVIVGVLGMINKETDKHNKNIVSNYMKYKKQNTKIHFAELPISFEKYYPCDRNISSNIGSKIIISFLHIRS